VSSPARLGECHSQLGNKKWGKAKRVLGLKEKFEENLQEAQNVLGRRRYLCLVLFSASLKTSAFYATPHSPQKTHKLFRVSCNNKKEK